MLKMAHMKSLDQSALLHLPWLSSVDQFNQQPVILQSQYSSQWAHQKLIRRCQGVFRVETNYFNSTWRWVILNPKKRGATVEELPGWLLEEEEEDFTSCLCLGHDGPRPGTNDLLSFPDSCSIKEPTAVHTWRRQEERSASRNRQEHQWCSDVVRTTG